MMVPSSSVLVLEAAAAATVCLHQRCSTCQEFIWGRLLPSYCLVLGWLK